MRDELQELSDFEPNQQEDVNYDELLEQAKEIKSYLDPTKYLSEVGDSLDKQQAITVAKDLNDQLMQEVVNNELQIEKLRTEHPEAEKHEFNKDAFQVSKLTKSGCLEFLKDNDVEIDSWINDADDNEKVKKILKIWFTLSQTYNKEDWCQFPKVLDDEAFYQGAKDVLLREAEMLGNQLFESNVV